MDRETIARYGGRRSDFSTISSQMRLTRGVDCAVFIHETDPGVWRLSLRSEKFVDAAGTVSLFGGGGHTRAAGCTIHAETAEEFSESVRILKENIAAQLEAALKG